MAASRSKRVAGIGEVFAVDLRSLAAFRIGTAALILVDLWQRGRDLTAYFTDQGILPRTARIELYELGDDFGLAHQWSLHMLSGQFWAQLLLMLIAALFAFWLLIGYRTRLAAVASWLLLMSLDARNPMILNSGDVLLRSMLFWAMFLPLGGCASLDRLLRPPAMPPPTRVLSAASVALLLQLAMMYVFSALFKAHELWLTEYSAIYYALHCDAYATPLGLALRRSPELMAALTRFTFWLELVMPVLAFSPLFHTASRIGIVLLFWAFHLGLALTMTIGLFAPICIVAWLVFLPSGFWDWLEARCRGGRLERRLLRGAVRLRRLAKSGRSWWPLRHAETPSFKRRPLVQLALSALLLYTLVWNVRELNVRYWEEKILPRQFSGLARALGLDQNWAMFSHPPRQHGWMVMRGVLRDGTEVNLWQPGEPLPWDPPPLISATYRSQRWRKYLDNLIQESYGPQRMYFANWLHYRWNRRHAGRDRQRELVEVQIILRTKVTPPPGQAIPEPEDRVLWTWYYE